MTRPDIAFAVNSLCAYVSTPGKQHYSLGLNVIGYLSTTRKLGITYGGRIQIPIGLSEFPPGFQESNGLYIIHDSSFGSRPRPMGGFAVMYPNGAVDWGANNLKLVPAN